MGTKYCTKCGVEKDESEFYKDCSHKDGLSSRCRTCDSEKYKQWRVQNLDHLNEYKKSWRETNRTAQQGITKRRHDKLHSRVESYKTACVKCGELRKYVIDYHHINNSDKSFTVGRGDKCFETLKQELLKCICLCRNCHAEFHHLYGNCPTDPVKSLTEYIGCDPYTVTPNVDLEV